MNQGKPSAELSLRAIVLGCLLSAVLGAANAYLGLFAGMTVSAAIPAAVLSMGLMRAFGGTILENNQVQTAASAGESAAAGAIFTLPALMLMGSWSYFPWLTCCVLVGVGGVLGVVFTTLLRRPLIVEGQLPFPEGVATAQVLLAGHRRDDQSAGGAPSAHLRALLLGSAVGAVFKLFESGLGLFQASLGTATRFLGGSFYLGMSTSPALLAVGSIVGPRIAALVCVGGVINWLGVIPWLTAAVDTGDVTQAAFSTWSQKTRYLGVGAMTFCGLYTLVDLRGTIKRAISDGAHQLSSSLEQSGTREGDLPFSWLLCGVAGCALTLTWLFSAYLPALWVSVLVVVAVIILSFLFCTVAAHMAGMLGSSNNPVSGVTIATLITVAFVLRALGIDPQLGAMTSIIVGSVVCTAAAIGGDNVQDLKAGHILGASPVRQQIMQLGGVLAAALVLGPVLQVLSDSYGFGQPSALHPRALLAPQATLMASVARGMFGGHLPLGYICAGALLGVVFATFDAGLKWSKARFRAPPLALSLGLYLPLELSTPVFLGGLAAHLLEKSSKKSALPEEVSSGLLLSAGLITGEALVGVMLAGVVFFVGSLEGLHVMPASGALTAAYVALSWWLLTRTSRADQPR